MCIFIILYQTTMCLPENLESTPSTLHVDGFFAVNPSASCPGGANARCLLLQQRDQGAEAEVVFTKSDVHSV